MMRPCTAAICRSRPEMSTTAVSGYGGMLTGAVIGGAGFALGGVIVGLVVAYLLKPKKAEEPKVPA